jgi:hypothetical protein
MFGLTIKRVVWIAVLLGLLFAAWQYIPPYITNLQLDSAVKHSVRFAAASRKTKEAVKLDVISKANELGISLDAKQIEITPHGSSFTLAFSYDVPINMRAYQDTLTFEVSAIGETFGQ